MISPLHIMLWAIILGATSSGMTVAIRALPTVQKWVMARKKPWACDICMSFWSVGLLALALGAWQGRELVIVCGPAYPWALWVLHKVTQPRGGLTLPDLEDSE